MDNLPLSQGEPTSVGEGESIRWIALGKTRCSPMTFERAVRRIHVLAAADRPALVVTPNIAHVLQADQYECVARAYARADLATPDGWPVVVAMRLFRSGLQAERVTGSDLLPRLAQEDLSMALIGGRGSSAEIAARRLSHGGAHVALVEPVPAGELDHPGRRAALIQRIAEAEPDLIFLALGVPKQEALALELMDALDRGVVLCVGAAVDFAAGTVKRAPKLVQRFGMEWLYRVVLEPTRMGPRYVRSAPHFVKAVAVAMWQDARRSRHS